MSTSGFATLRLFTAASLLTLLAACGGGGGGGGTSSTPATKLVHTSDPSATTADWRVEADPATNGTRTVVFHVYGPAGTTVQGTTVFLSCTAPETSWVQPTGATDPYALPGTALDLAQGPNVSVQLFKSHRINADLQVAAYQKSGTAVLTSDHPLFSVAIDLADGVDPGPVSPFETAGRTSIYLDGTGEHPLTLKLGTLTAE